MSPPPAKRLSRRARWHLPGRHPDDRTILALALPALAALAADPLYSLTDTAFVGNLGAEELGAVAVGSAAFTASFWLFSFLAYGVTPRVARFVGAGDEVGAARIGVQALLMAVSIGVCVTLVGVLFAGPVVRLLGAGPGFEQMSESYLRIRVLSASAVLIAQVGHGWLRGEQDTRIPMFIAVGGAAINVVLDYVLIYPAGMGVQGAAWATVIGQYLAAAGFLVVLMPRLTRGGVGWRFDRQVATGLLRIGADLVVRTGSLLGAMTLATSVAARMGLGSLGAWQITMQLFLFLSLVLDSVAIAAQALVGKHLGAEARGEAREVSARLMEWGLLVGVGIALILFLLRDVLAAAFSSDESVVVAAAALIAWLAAVQPLSALAFTLDGILIGASDTRFLAKSMVASSLAYAAISLLAVELGWGTAGLAAGATVWMLLRTATTAWRWRGGRWTLVA
ncbi:MAG: MATE family efflux transporter [Actinomycetota bacterium]